MAVPGRYIFIAFVLSLMPGAAAYASCGQGESCHRPPPQQTCRHNCAPPQHQPCRSCAPTTVVVPPPYVPPPNVVVVNAGAQAHASSVAIAVAQVRQGDVFVRGGGGGFVGGAATAGVSSAALSVTEGAMVMESAMRRVAVQAICLDAQGNPHPASQTFAARDVDDAYAGEIFRCMAGTKMRVTQEGASFDCAPGEALWHENGRLACRTQIARRPCNERSLLRRFGPGEKLVTIREERQARRETQFNAQMTMDGGVGQGVW